jgi:Zn-dependent oligopeptidase
MKANGGLTRKNSERFRKYILSVGNSVDLNEAFKIYRTRYGNRALFKKWDFLINNPVFSNDQNGIP